MMTKSDNGQNSVPLSYRMRVVYHTLAVHDQYNVLHDTVVGAWVEPWLHFSRHGMKETRWACSEAECPFLR